MEQTILDLAEEEVAKDELQKKPAKKKPAKAKKVDVKSDQEEPSTETETPEVKETPESDIKAKGQWHTNILGTPPKKATPNPYFEGVIGTDGLVGNVIYVPFKGINMISKQVYVEDIHVQNPEVLRTIYRVVGDFRNVVARIDEATFLALQTHPDVKLKRVSYNYVSDHDVNGKIVYSFTDSDWPTLKALKQKDVEYGLVTKSAKSLTPEVEQVDPEDEPTSETNNE